MEEAVTLLDEAYEQRRAILGVAHVDTLRSMNAYGWLLKQQGKHDVALPLLQEALASRRSTLGNTAPDTLTSMNCLGRLLEEQGNFREALFLFEEGVNGRRLVFGDKHPKTMISLNNFGRLLAGAGRLDEAIMLLEEVLAYLVETKGKDDKATEGAQRNVDLLRSAREDERGADAGVGADGDAARRKVLFEQLKSMDM